MSIILEALNKMNTKKKQEEIKLTPKKTDHHPLISTAPAPTRRKKTIYFPLILTISSITTVLLLSIIAANYINRDLTDIKTEHEIFPEISQPEKIDIVALLQNKESEEIMPRLQVSGIIWDEQGPTALINNKLLAPGEKIKGARIVSIEQDSVKFHYQGKEFQIQLES